MDKRILDRIKKCLRLAQSGNANEAATALRQAQALMALHGVTQEQIDLSDVKMETRDASRSKTVPYYIQCLGGAIKSIFGVDGLYDTNWMTGKKRINFIGIGARPEIAAYAYEVLARQLVRDRTAYLKTLKRFKRANKTRKADLFAEHWVYAAAEKAAVLAISDDHMALIKRFQEESFGKLVEVKRKLHKAKQNDLGAMIDGSRAGSAATIHHGVNGADPVKAISHD